MARRRNPEREAIEREWFRGVLVSCPDCGVLVHKGYGDGPSDLQREWVTDLVVPVLGLEAVLRQGVGVNDGLRHVCPPCRSAVAVLCREGESADG